MVQAPVTLPAGATLPAPAAAVQDTAQKDARFWIITIASVLGLGGGGIVGGAHFTDKDRINNGQLMVLQSEHKRLVEDMAKSETKFESLLAENVELRKADKECNAKFESLKAKVKKKHPRSF